MNAGKAFIDSNVFLYLHSKTEENKRRRAFDVINRFHRIISTQVLNEFCNVSLKKMGRPFDEVKISVNSIITICDVLYIDEKTILSALDLHGRYGYSYCLMIAAALLSGCTYLFSEDMSDGQIIDGKVTIINIFVNKTI
jgi:predicted nucleic acid-binding protein